jgi:hypothetical protein
MGMYSEIRAQLQCDYCGSTNEVRVQFKYGNLYDHEYAVGDKIVWGRFQVGDPSERRVVARGIAGCPKCGQNAYFDILIENGCVRSVIPANGLYDYHHGEGNYVVLEAGEP